MNEDAAQNLLVSMSETTRYPWRPIPSRQLARFLGVSIQTLANWRMRETGPAWEPLRRGQGNRIYYRPDKVMAWLSEIAGSPQAPWEFAHAYLVGRGMDNLPKKQGVVEQVTRSIDRQTPSYMRQPYAPSLAR